MIGRSFVASCLAFLQVAIFALTIAVGCKGAPTPPAPAGSGTAAAQALPYPSTVAQADEMKKGGASWTNEEIRVFYNKVVSTIAASNEHWKQDGLSAEERARRAFEVRHGARMLARAMMASRFEVEMLQKRDQEKYGNPHGPTFEHLVESAKKKGTIGDEIFEGIIASAQRTDEATNAAFGVKRDP